MPTRNVPIRSRPKSSVPHAGGRRGGNGTRPPALHSNLVTSPLPEPSQAKPPR